ncbi:MAG: glycosyltransferase family 4 protein, partial [Bacteroidales bacterium]|nr:glycosyltransferase family 4 protein [Bacteroidales bacterium]
MINIYQLITSIYLGGSENVAFQLAEYCKKNNPGNFRFTVIELYKTRNKYAEDKKKGLADKKIHALTLFKGSKRLSLIFAPIKLAYILWKNKPDIVHSHTDLPDLVLASTMRILTLFNIKKPAIARTIHSTQLWSTHPKLAKYTESAYHNDRVVSVSQGALKAHKDLRSVNNLTISSYQEVIYNGCRIPKRLAHPFSIDNDKINIAFCGRFEVYKGIDTLIWVIKELNELYPDSFVFHITGNGSYLDSILKLSKENHNVYVYDSVPNISDKLYAFDFIFMPSHFEGLPLVSIESSFAKVPVIASFAPGLDETLPEKWPLRFKLENENELLKIFERIKNS